MAARKELQSEKEGEVEERSAEVELEVERTTEEVCNEEEKRAEDASESYSTAKRARISSVFSDSQEAAIVEFTLKCLTNSMRDSTTGTKKKLCGLKFQKN